LLGGLFGAKAAAPLAVDLDNGQSLEADLIIRGLIPSGKGLGVWKQKLLKDPTRIMEAYLGAVQGQG
jgi:hypothetical protein